MSDNELNTITAGTVMIGDTNSGDINVSSTINVADNTTPIPVLKLVTGAAITGSGSLTVNSLMLEAVNGIGSKGVFRKSIRYKPIKPVWPFLRAARSSTDRINKLSALAIAISSTPGKAIVWKTGPKEFVASTSLK